MLLSILVFIQEIDGINCNSLIINILMHKKYFLKM